MFHQVKENVFTLHALITTFIHLFLVVGFVTCWVTFQVHVLGNDPVEQFQQSVAPSSSSGKKK